MEESVKKEGFRTPAVLGKETPKWGGLPEAVRKQFGCEGADLRAYPALTLAFLGDCVYDLVIRTIVAERAKAAPARLHRAKSEVVKATAQAQQIDALLPELTEEELAVYKRGRNANSHSAAKNASIVAYRKATGLEALYGYLYLADRTDRLLYLIKRSLELTETEL